MPSLKPLWLSVGPLSEWLNRTASLHVGLDFDGTLTPLAPDPREAVLAPRARSVLERLARDPRTKLALLSSRRLDDLTARVGIEGIFYAGSSGLETLDEAGCREVHAGAGVSLPTPLLRDLQSWCDRFPGAWLEARVNSCALHFASVAMSLQPAFGAGVRRRLRPFQAAVRLVHGRTGFEVMPAGGWDKAKALDRWLRDAPEGTALLFFGDDRRDEPVHAAVRARGGFAVAVDRVVSHAEYALPTPGDVVWFLEWIEREWKSRPAPTSGAAREELETSPA
jgi:trehalose-phosphatase